MESLPISELAALPRRFNFFKSTPRLPAESIGAGFCPPLLVSRGSLVWGSPYLDAALGVVAAPGLAAALPVDRADLSPEEELLQALAREGRCGAYSAEEAFAIGRAAASIAEDRGEAAGVPGFLEAVSALVLGSGGLPALLSRLDALPAARRALAESGLVDLKTVERCKSLPEEAASAFPRLAASLSASERRLALGWLDDIALHEGLSGEAAAGLVASVAEAANPLAALKSRRYPELSAMEADFARIAKESLGGRGLKLEAPPNFEGPGFALSIAFSSKAELERRLAAAAGLSERADELLALLR